MATDKTAKEAQKRTDALAETDATLNRKTSMGVERDAAGNVSAVRLDRRVADPTSPEAVQVPANTVPASHERQLGVGDSVTNDDLEQLEANNVKIGDVTAESLEVSSKSHNPVSPAMERLQAAREELDEHNAQADAGRAESNPGDTATADAESSRSDDK